MLSPLPPAIRYQRLTTEVICGDNERTVRLRFPDVNNPDIAATRRLADGHPGTVPAWPILSWILQDLLYLFFADVVFPDVRLASRWV